MTSSGDAGRVTRRFPGVLEVGALHVVAWWGVRILTSQLPLLHYWAAGSAGWWLARLVRAGLAAGIVLAWAAVRGVALPRLGLGGRGFWRNGAVAFLITSTLWLVVAVLRGKGIRGPYPAAFPLRELAVLTTLVDVVSQQLPTFGLLQGALGSSAWVVGVTWLSFTAAHLVGASPATVLVAGIVGCVFALLRRHTGNLGAGLGVHVAYYSLLILLGWGVGVR